MTLFKPTIYAIEINDKTINEDMGKLILRIEQYVIDLINTIKEQDIPGKEEDTKRLLMLFLDVKGDIDTIKRDLMSIINIELQKKKYIIVKDDAFIEDKIHQIELMQNHIDELITVIQERPSNKEYTRDVLQIVTNNINALNKELQQIKEDDASLAYIYKNLSEM